MAKYIMLLNWTEQGVKAIRESANRLDAARKLVADHGGGKIEQIYMTLGQYDQVAIVDSPDDMTLAANNLRLASSGFVRTQTLRAFTEDEYRSVIAGL